MHARVPSDAAVSQKREIAAEEDLLAEMSFHIVFSIGKSYAAITSDIFQVKDALALPQGRERTDWTSLAWIHSESPPS
jgi:hypothetical protein